MSSDEEVKRLQAIIDTATKDGVEDIDPETNGGQVLTPLDISLRLALARRAAIEYRSALTEVVNAVREHSRDVWGSEGPVDHESDAALYRDVETVVERVGIKWRE